MFGDRFSSSTNCSRWLHETEPGRPDQSLSCCFLKVATHPFNRITPNQICCILIYSTNVMNSLPTAQVQDRWLSVDELAGYLGIKRDTVYKWITRRSMPAHKLGRLWKFRKEEVDAWVRTGAASDPDK